MQRQQPKKAMGTPHYSEKFKRETVSLVVDRGYTKTRTADVKGVSAKTVSKWIKEAGIVKLSYADLLARIAELEIVVANVRHAVSTDE